MRYKRSCFNPTLAKHDLRRFWPLPVAIFVFFLVTMVLDYYNSMVSITSGNVAYAVRVKFEIMCISVIYMQNISRVVIEDSFALTGWKVDARRN